MYNRTIQFPSHSFYKRELPPSCISFNSEEGKELFKKALEEDHLEAYFSLSMQYLTQSEPAFCGLGSLCMVLNASGVDPLRQWKGVWRWFDESMLDCCRPLEEIKQHGISLPEFVCIARCNRLRARCVRADKSTLEGFIKDVKNVSKSQNKYIVVSYDRGTLNQTGTGHFSPIGGYCEKSNMMLVMDVARFKYPAYWVSADLLWKSLFPIDVSTGNPRGYVVLEKGTKGYAQSALMQLSCNKDSWYELSNILFKELPKKVRDMDPENITIESFLTLIISAIPDKFYSVVDDRYPLFVTHDEQESPCKATNSDNETFRIVCGDCNERDCSKSYIAGLDELLRRLSETELYKLVASSIEARRKLSKIITETEDHLSNSSFSPHLVMRSLKSANSFRSSRQNSFMDGSSLGLIPNYSFERQNSLKSGTYQFEIPNENLIILKPAPNGINHARKPSLEELQSYTEPVNDFIAFLTMFLFALFSYCPDIYLNISSSCKERGLRDCKIVEQIRNIVQLDNSGQKDDIIYIEIQFLRDQIAALTELVSDSGTK